MLFRKLYHLPYTMHTVIPVLIALHCNKNVGLHVVENASTLCALKITRLLSNKNCARFVLTDIVQISIQRCI